MIQGQPFDYTLYYFQDLSIVNDLTLLFKLYYRGQTPVYPTAQFLTSGK